MVDMKEIKDSLPDEDDANDPDVSFQTHHLAFFIAAIGRRKVPTKIHPPRTSPDRPTVPQKHSQFAHVDKAEMLKALGQLGNNAGLIGALQHKLDDLVGMSSGFVESLHWKVRARVNALSEAQGEYDELYGKFLEEKRALEERYAKLYAPLYAKRAAIVKGEKDVDAKPEDGDDADEEAPKGVPDFWLCALRNHELLGGQITEKDEGALKHLVDVTSRSLTKEDIPKDEDDEEEDDEEEEEPIGFALEFHFEPNDYFEDAVLSKKYFMADMDDPILEHSEGTDIAWKQGKNLTVKVLRKKPKKGAAKNAKPITKTEKTESFFNFFSPPEVPDEEAELDPEEVEQLQEAMEMDYEIGAIIKDKIIPNAVEWFTGEANEDEDDEDYSDEDDEDDEDDFDGDDSDEDDSDDEDAAPKKGKGKKGGADGEEKPPECKQQ